MISRRNRNQPSDRDLVALADGSIRASRRARVERAVADSDDLQQGLAAQRRALRAVRDAAIPAPGALRARLELARAPRPAARRSPHWSLRTRPAFAGLGALAVAAVLVLTGVVGGGFGGRASGPTVAAAAALGTRAPVGVTAAGDPHVIAAGIRFPDWRPSFGLSAAGVRRDTLDGRLATTVYYDRGGQQIAYTIVSGAPLSAGAATTSTVWNGVRLSSLPIGARAVVTWVRDGHSCVLSAPRSLLKSMMGLAAWTGNGTAAAGSEAPVVTRGYQE